VKSWKRKTWTERGAAREEPVDRRDVHGGLEGRMRRLEGRRGEVGVLNSRRRGGVWMGSEKGE